MTTKNPSQTELYGELLTSQQQYRKDIAPFREISCEQEHVFVHAAREGDEQARNNLILSLLDYVEYWASLFVSTYGWISRSIELTELISIGNFKLVESFDEAMDADNPWAFLASRAKYAMHSYCQNHTNCITTPHHAKSYVVESLDKPLNEDTEETLIDFLSEPNPVIWFSSLSISDERIYTAIGHLGGKQKELVKRVYGLDGYERERMSDIRKAYNGKEVTEQCMSKLRDGALASLRQFLETEENLCTMADVISALEISEWGVYQLVRSGRLTRVAKGRYLQRELDILIEQKRRGIFRMTYAHPEKETPETCTIAQACEVLAIDKHRFFYLVKHYHLRCVSHGYYRKGDIEMLLQKRKEIAS